MESDDLTFQLALVAQRACRDNLPAEVVRMSRLALLDHIGLCVRGASQEATQIAAQELLGRAIAADEMLPEAGPVVPLTNVAMVRAIAAHALDYDDTLPSAHAAHVGSVVLGALVPLAQALGKGGSELLPAIVAGYEVAARVGALLQPEHYLKGFHSTATIGVFGATAACARLMGLDSLRTRAALGLAATQAAGLKCVFGTMAKPFNAGHAASAGLLATRLAARGFSAPTDALESDKGYLDLFMGQPQQQRRIAPWGEFLIMGNLFKFHAACHATHPMIEALQSLMAEHRFRPDDVAHVEVEAATLSLRTASIGIPQTGLGCKFSYRQVAALVLAARDTAADDAYADAMLADPMVNQLRDKVTVLEAPDLHPTHTRVRIRLNHGGTLQRQLDFMKDAMGCLATVGERLEAKFLSNTAPLLGRDRSMLLKGHLLSL